MTKQVSILGATGSIGMSTLDVIARQPDKFQLYAVSANTRVERLRDICLQHQPKIAVMSDRESADRLRDLLGSESTVEVLGGTEALQQIAAADEVDIVMAAIVGSVGLMPTLSAVRAGKRVLLANKETLVMAGHLFMQEIARHHAELLPIDSEHNAMFQCLPSDYRIGSDDQPLKTRGITRILLTGSGGPFRKTPLNQFDSITPEQAIAHPNWSMGPKISVDSATMMNKGLELIEACWLFNMDESDIDIVLHPQSIIHSMVAYNDGSVLAQMGNPDMRTPIAHALCWPDRMNSGVEPLDLIKVSQLNFEQADEQRFPCLRLARQAIKQGGTSMAILNAANEVAVQSFLSGQIRFTRIAELIEQALQVVESIQTDSLDEILEHDRKTRSLVHQWINQNL